MSIKKLFALVLVMAMSLTLLAGCAQTATTAAPAATTAAAGETTTAAPAAGEKKVVGVMIADMSAQFQAYIMDGMKRQAEQYPDYDFVFVDGKFDSATQMNQAENFISQGVDALIYIPGDAEASVNLVNKVVEANIPIIGCNTKVKEMDKLTTYAGSDTVESGRILMEGIAQVMGGKGDLIELQGFYGHEPQIERHNGVLETLANYPDMKIIKEDSGEWSRDKGMQKMENILQSDLAGKFQGVVCHNDEMAIGAMKALDAAGMLDGMVVAGIDATPEALKYLKEGKLALTVFQDALGQGSMAIDLAVKVIKGEQVEKEVMVPYVLVMPEEADKYLAIYDSLK
ncbi:MAG: sugar ABC transporter substrate-binding protein [Clostridia bacterium]|nr:sugar ABC transporter substrate-binding protein [Clostridia bacterium]